MGFNFLSSRVLVGEGTCDVIRLYLVHWRRFKIGGVEIFGTKLIFSNKKWHKGRNAPYILVCAEVLFFVLIKVIHK